MPKEGWTGHPAILLEPTCAFCTVGSYASLSVCLSVCVDWTRNYWIILHRIEIHIWKSIISICKPTSHSLYFHPISCTENLSCQPIIDSKMPGGNPFKFRLLHVTHANLRWAQCQCRVAFFQVWWWKWSGTPSKGNVKKLGPLLLICLFVRTFPTSNSPKMALTFSWFKDTCYAWCKKQQNLQLLDILACNSANKPSFQNPTKHFCHPRHAFYAITCLKILSQFLPFFWKMIVKWYWELVHA